MKILSLLCFGTVVALANHLEAAPIMYRFSGQGNQTIPGSSDSPWQIPAGPQDFSGTFVYDAANPLDPLSLFSVNVGGTSIELESYTPVAQDELLILARGTPYVVRDAFAGFASTIISFHDSDSSTLDAGAFPATLRLDDFDGVQFQLSAHHNLCAIDTLPGHPCQQAYEMDFSFMGTVGHLEAVPEPSTTVLLAIGTSCISALSIRKRRPYSDNQLS